MRTGRSGLMRFGLLALLLSLGCPAYEDTEGKMSSPPSFDSLLQEYSTEVDDDNDAGIDASDSGSTPGGPSAPGLLSTSTSPAAHSVSLSVSNDSDTVAVNCEHTLAPGTSATRCTGTARAVFEVAEPGNTQFHVTAFKSPAGLSAPVGLEGLVVGDVTIDCGSDTASEQVQRPAGGPGVFSSLYPPLTVELGSPCEVTIAMTASVTTSGLAVPTSVLQTVSVTAVTAAVPDCTDSSQCTGPEAPVCDSTGKCGSGEEGQPGVVAAVHCAPEAPYISQTGCSHGVSGSTCRGDFECADGYSCTGSVCAGDLACSNDLDCPAEKPVCTEQGTCSPYGEQGENCVTGEFCRQGLICLYNRCAVILGLGEDCSVPNTLCGAPLRCFSSSNTCENPLPLGASCSDDNECEDYPSLNSCNVALGSVCATRSDPGGACTKDLDCKNPFTGCDTNTDTCN